MFGIGQLTTQELAEAHDAAEALVDMHRKHRCFSQETGMKLDTLLADLQAEAEDRQASERRSRVSAAAAQAAPVPADAS